MEIISLILICFWTYTTHPHLIVLDAAPFILCEKKDIRKEVHLRIIVISVSNRPFPYSSYVNKQKEMRTRFGWTISYKSLYFVQPSLGLVPLFTGTRERSIRPIFLLLFLFLPKEKAKNNEGKGLIDLTEIQETRDMQ